MYDISTGAVNKLNGELSSAFVNVAEENASSEDLEHASTLDPSVLETMMQKSQRWALSAAIKCATQICEKAI